MEDASKRMLQSSVIDPAPQERLAIVQTRSCAMHTYVNLLQKIVPVTAR